MTKITEKELNMVAGGTFGETAFDSEALHFKGYMDEEFSSWDMMFHWLTYSAKVDEGWAKAGITSVTCPFDLNRYYVNGKRISRDTAMHLIGIR